MKLTTSKRALACAVALVALGGASVASAQTVPGATKLFLSNGQTVQVFAINNQSPGSPIATIQSSEAEGLAVDRRGKLLVARQRHSEVAIYDTASLRLVRRLLDPGQQPSSIAVGHNGTIYVGNVLSTKNGRGSVSVYEAGSGHPTRVLTCPSFFMVTGVAVDALGDLFVNQNRTSNGNPEVDMFPAGSTKCHPLSIGEYYAGGATIDPNTNDLILADEGYRRILVVAPPYGSVTQTITLPRCIGEQVLDLALDPETSLLYISDPGNGSDVLGYPGGSRVATYYMSAANGIAIAR